MKWSLPLLLFVGSTWADMTSETDRATRLLDADQAANIVDAVQTNIPEEALRPSFVRLLVAIRLSENGGKGREFGVMSKKANTYRRQAGWCAAICWLRYQEWKDGDKMPSKFLVYLANRYAPVGASNDPLGKNSNWLKNVQHYMREDI